MGIRAGYRIEKPQLENHRNVTPGNPWAKRALVLALAMAAAACSLFKQEDRFTAEATSFAALEGWTADDHRAALDVFLLSCNALAQTPRPQTEKSNITIDKATWEELCKQGQTAFDARFFFEQNFIPSTVGNNHEAKGLFTGYYEPLLYGALQKNGDFRYPIYERPKDLQEDAPYLTREQIETIGLEGKAPVLAWVNDPVMLFFMHVQGSGRIRLEDGRDMKVGFAARNNHPYASIGKVLRDEKLMASDKIDFFSIRQWLYDHPDKAPAILWHNPSYIFFQELGEDSPKGALGVPLTPGRSLAIDKRYIPYGLPLFLQATVPNKEGEPLPLNRLMIAQDTGSAITGPVRGDLFFGYGEDAEYCAGMMKSPGRYTLLVPRPIAAQLR